MGCTADRIGIKYTLLVTNKLRTFLADETHPLRPEFDNRHMDRSYRLRIPRSKTTRYLQSFIPTAIGTHNHNKQADNCNARRLEMGCGDDEAMVKWRNVWERMGGSCLCEDCNLEE